MDHQGMDINDLIGKADAELRRIGYSNLCIERQAAVWNNLTDYMVRNDKTLYTAKVGMNFLEEKYEITVYEKLDSQKKSVAPGQSIY
jgi:hypothetical protein